MTTAPGFGAGGRWAAPLELLASGWRMIGINALWVLASIPLVTIGPATIAVMAMARDDVRGRPRPAVRGFLTYMRENAWTGVVLSLLTIGPMAGLLLLWLPHGGIVGTFGPLFQVVSLFGGVATAPLLAHGYALAAHTTLRPRGLVRASYVMAAARPGSTLLALAVVVALTALAWSWPFALAFVGYLGARAVFTSFVRAFDGIQGKGGVNP